jgi:DNA-directed RNA polymerase subunit RPC12/RpoP
MTTEASKLRVKRWKAAHPEQASAIQKRADWKARLRQKGFTPALFGALMVEQTYRCAICGADISDGAIPDHDHETGENRGLLCNGCNLMLGWAHDNVETLTAAAAYLIEWGA